MPERGVTGSEPRRLMPDQRAALERARTALTDAAKQAKEHDPVWADVLGAQALAADVTLSCECGGTGELPSGWPCICDIAKQQAGVTVEVVEVGRDHDERTEVQKWIDECNEVGAECSRLEADLLDIHDALVAAGQPGAINAGSIIERIEAMAGERERTVDAVVEALRKHERAVVNVPGPHWFDGFDEAVRVVAERFKPSTRGQQ